MSTTELFEDPAFEAGAVAGRLRLGEPVRVLSLWQPWASLVALGLKEWETRSWSTRWRGLVAIHAARTTVGMRSWIPRDLANLIARCGAGCPEFPDPVPLGSVVALVQLIDVRSTGTDGTIAPWIDRLGAIELTCGNFYPDRYGWQLRRVGAIEQPIPFRAGQGLRTAPLSLTLQLAEALRPLATT